MKRIIIALIIVLTFGTASHAYSPDEITQLVGPVALYPDALLSDVLTASSYPAEVQNASQWVNTYGAPQPAAVDAALANVDWDPAVKSLTAIPSVLNYMAANLAWTTALGNAFLSQPQDVYEAIQTLRAQALSDGTLQSNDQVVVTNDNGAILIEEANPQYLYVPTYNADAAYYGYSPIVYGPPILIGAGLWFGVFDWHYHHLYFGRGYNYWYRGRLPENNQYYNQVRQQVGSHQGLWQFNTQHRHGLAVPPPNQFNAGRGFSPPNPVNTGRGFSPPNQGNSGHGTHGNSGHGVSPPSQGNPGPTLPPATFHPPVLTTSPPTHEPPSLFNVRPSGPVNIERGQGAASRGVTVPAPMRPFSPPVVSRPPPPVRTVPAPRPMPPSDHRPNQH